MKPKKEVTIYDIAQKLAVSSATVSRGLNDHPSISKPTRKRIQEAARELGYRHNSFASGLRRQRSNTIGVLVHRLNSNFVASVIAGIEKVTSEMGYDLLIAHSAESGTKEAANALNLFHKRVDGLIASLAFDTDNLDHFRVFEEKGIPLIFFDRVEENCDYTKVVIDNYKCGYQATSHLIEQGCQRIALITPNLKRNVYSQRFRGYRDALFDNSIPFAQERILVHDLGEQNGSEAALQILKMDPLPDGIFAANDFTAAACMKTLQDHGIRIPEDIAIIGFNNDAIGTLITPRLSTVDYPGFDLGEIAGRHLLNHLNGVEQIQKTQTIVVRSELVIRESSLRKAAE